MGGGLKAFTIITVAFLAMTAIGFASAAWMRVEIARSVERATACQQEAR